MLHLSAEHESILSVVVPQCTLTLQPLSSRHHAAIHWCHNQPRPQPCALFSLLGKGTAFVSTQLSGRSRCRRQRDLQLDMQTPKCSGALVMIAICVSPSGEEQWSEAEGHPFVLTCWQNSGLVSPDALGFPTRALNPCREVIPSFPVRITLTVPN